MPSLTLTPLAAGTSVGYAAASSLAEAFKVTGDSANRHEVYADGDLWWGSGSGAVDTNLYRSAANTLKTDDAFVIGSSSGLTLSDASTLLSTAIQSYTPTWSSSGTQPSLGNGTITGSYVRIGKLVVAKFHIVCGTTTTYGTGSYSVSLPFTPDGSYEAYSGWGTVYLSGGASQNNIIWRGDAGLLRFNESLATVQPTVPITYTTGSVLHATICYHTSA